MTRRFKKLIAAPHTPMRPDGVLDLDRVPVLAAHLARSGVTGVFVAGTTGECHSLTISERRGLAERWCAVKEESGLEVIVHAGSNCLDDARALAAHAAECGADAVSTMAPFFFKPGSVEQLVGFCAEVARSAGETPFYFYHIPALTGVDLTMEPFLEGSRSAIPTLRGIKHTSPDMDDYRNCVRFDEGAFDILFGTDERLIDGLSLGACGAVGSTYNFAAPLYLRLIDAFEAGDFDEARREQARSNLLVETIANYGYTAAAKSVMAMIGVDCGPARQPLAALDTATQARLRSDLERIGFFEWAATAEER